ncbi:MAG: peptide chain release factor N(5)-glutamine methyltransferase [Acidobacteria bacterium]|nr:peptide chain release factor N(5)-glutamine methyltransferase [Acidobacteriota bacterium]
MTEVGDMAVTWRVLHEEAVSALSELDSSAVDVRWMIEEATGATPQEFPTQLDKLVTVQAKARFDSMVRRRLDGEPMQYVLGRWEFRRLDLAVDPRVLIPRPETEVVAGIAIAELKVRGAESPKALDLGTGSGAIALAIADECVETFVWAVDASADALVVARANLAGLGAAATRVQMLESNWFDGLDPSLRGEFDVVISNPPYVARDEHLPAVVRHWEPEMALVAGPSGFESVSHIVESSLEWLTPRGLLVVEIAPGQAEKARRLAQAVGFSDADVRDDLSGRPRALVARR